MTIISARRAPRVHKPSRSQKPGIVAGLRYERAFVHNLRIELKSHNLVVEYQPWFFYKTDDDVSSACAPDILLIDEDRDLVHVLEVKYTWVEDAITKLRDLYCPVVEMALGRKTRPVVVVKRLLPTSPQPGLGLLVDIDQSLFQWTGLGKIVL